MADYDPKIDILVLTSAREAQPLVLLEAMCTGIPCIATDVGACREMLVDVGFVTQKANPQETAEAIIRLCNNENLRNTLSQKSRERVRLSYNVTDVIERYRKIYHESSKEIKTLKMEEYGRNRIPIT